MERLWQLLNFIQARLSVLTVSQRIAIGLCAALIAGSFLWLLQWSAAPDLAPLVTRDFSYGELDAAETALKTNGIPYEIHGTTVFVRAADRHNVLRLLHAANALPEGSLFDMAAAVAEQNPFQAPEQREYAQNYAMGNELAKIIATAAFVKEARVLINPRTKRRLGGATDIPTASVALNLEPGHEINDAMVDGFAKLVAGAVAGLKPQNVAVTDVRTGRSYNVPAPDDMLSFDALGMEQKREDHLRSKILATLADVPGVRVAVRVELDTTKRVTQKLKHDAPQPRTESNQSSETSGGGRASEPGVQANLGQAVAEDGGGQSNTTEESKTENFEPKLSQTETIEQLPFAVKKVTAAVGIPRSFISNVFKLRFPEKAEPKDADPDFVTLRDAQVKRVRASVEKIVMAKNPDDVEVDVYPDVDWSVEGGSWSRAPEGTSVIQAGAEGFDPMGLLRNYGPQFGLGVLALMSLFMVSRIAGRASAVSVSLGSAGVSAPNQAGEEPILTVGPHPIGQAAVASGSVLMGREVNVEMLRYQELGDEVSKLVESDPEGTAQLIRRWIEDS
jgi:flagellar biosynthesis/type III secretory pathway M-ring protein FliF/YscJ